MEMAIIWVLPRYSYMKKCDKTVRYNSIWKVLLFKFDSERFLLSFKNFTLVLAFLRTIGLEKCFMNLTGFIVRRLWNKLFRVIFYHAWDLFKVFLFNHMLRNVLGTSLVFNNLTDSLIKNLAFSFLFQKLMSFHDTEVACQES